MLAKGGKAHDGQNSAYGGAVQGASGEKQEGRAQQSVAPRVDEDGGGAEHTQIIAGGPATGLEQPPVAR